MTPLFALSLLLSAPLVVPGVGEQLAGDGEEPDVAADVLRLYDVSTLRLEDADGRFPDGTLLPYLPYHVSEDDSSYEESTGGADALVDLIVDLYGEEFEYEGRGVDVSGDARLAVRGPEGLHERVARLIGFFETALAARTTLAVDVITLPPGASLPGGAESGSLVAADRAEGWVRAAAGEGRLESYHLQVRADRPARLDLGQDQAVVTDLDVEIAQGAAIMDPIVTRVAVGTRLEVAAAPDAEGTWLALKLQRGRWVEDQGRRTIRDLRLRYAVGSADESGGIDLVEHVSRIPDPLVLARSMALSTFLPSGRALVLSNALDLARDGVHEVIVLRLVGGGLPVRHELPLGQDGARLIVADLGAAVPPRVVAQGQLLERGYVPRSLGNAVSGYAPLLDARIEEGDVDFVVDRAGDGGQDYSSVDHFGRWLVSRPYGSFLGADAAEARAEQERLVATLEALRPARTLYDVELRLRRAGGATPVATRLPLRAGCSVSLALGIEGLDVRDYDVEVAQFASTPDPQMGATFDGLCVWLKPTPTADGRLQLELRGGANLWVADGTVDLGSSLFDSIDATRSEHLFAEERALLEPGADGVYRLTLGDVAGLALEVALRRQ